MKKIRILIIVSVVLLLLICGAIVATYFMTDIFKSDKEVFYKYASQIKMNELMDEKFYTEYADKLANNKTTQEGSMSAKDATMGLEYLKVDYAGKNDNQSKFSKNEFKISLVGQELLGFNIMRNNDSFGLIIDEIINKYIVIENNNLKEFAAKLGIADTSAIPDKIDFDSLQITEQDKQEMKELYNKYFNIAIGQIPDNNYSKLSKTDIQLDGQVIQADGCKLTLSIKDIANMITKVLDTAKNDNKLLSLINKYNQGEEITFEAYTVLIDSLLEEIDLTYMTEEEINKEFISVSIYQNGGKTLKTEAKMGNEEFLLNILMEQINNKIILTASVNYSINMNSITSYGYEEYTPSTLSSKTSENIMQIVKTGDASGSNWDIIITTLEDNEETLKIDLNISRVGDINSNQIEHKANLNFDSYVVTLDDRVNFVSSIDIEEFTNENHIVINNLSAGQLEQLFNFIFQKVMEKFDMNSLL